MTFSTVSWLYSLVNANSSNASLSLLRLSRHLAYVARHSSSSVSGVVYVLPLFLLLEILVGGDITTNEACSDSDFASALRSIFIRSERIKLFLLRFQAFFLQYRLPVLFVIQYTAQSWWLGTGTGATKRIHWLFVGSLFQFHRIYFFDYRTVNHSLHRRGSATITSWLLICSAECRSYRRCILNQIWHPCKGFLSISGTGSSSFFFSLWFILRQLTVS